MIFELKRIVSVLYRPVERFNDQEKRKNRGNLEVKTETEIFLRKK